MSSEDKDNYGTPFSYATKHQDNEASKDIKHKHSSTKIQMIS